MQDNGYKREKLYFDDKQESQALVLAIFKPEFQNSKGFVKVMVEERKREEIVLYNAFFLQSICNAYEREWIHVDESHTGTLKDNIVTLTQFPVAK